MAAAVDALWPADAPLSGLVVTRYGHIPPRPAGLPQRIEVVEAAHPVPDAAGLAAAQRILKLDAWVQAWEPERLGSVVTPAGLADALAGALREPREARAESARQLAAACRSGYATLLAALR